MDQWTRWRAGDFENGDAFLQIAFESILKCGMVTIAYGSRWHSRRDLGAKGFDRLVDSAHCDDLRCDRFDG